MKVAIISANLGSYDPPHPWVEQVLPEGVSLDVIRLTDETFPPRKLAMTSRLQCAIPKMFGWQMYPDFDFYIWVDASMAVSDPDCVSWFLDHCKDSDIAVFRHPDRKTIKEEYEFVKKKLAEGNRYLTSRYEGEWLDDQAVAILGDPTYRDDALYASTAFCYRPNRYTKEALSQWWFHKTRFLLHDQLAFPYVLRKADCKVNVIEENYTKCQYISYVRNKKKSIISGSIKTLDAPQSTLNTINLSGG